MTKTKKDIISDFARKASASIGGTASVSDNWISQIKTYKKIELTDGDTALIWVWTIAMFSELLLARVEDMLNTGELSLLESEMFDWNIKGITTLGVEHTNDKKLAKEREVFITKIFNDVLKRSREERKKNGYTIPEVYTSFFLNSHTFGEKIPSDILSAYLVSQIESFESLNLRNELWNDLRSLDT